MRFWYGYGNLVVMRRGMDRRSGCVHRACIRAAIVDCVVV